MPKPISLVDQCCHTFALSADTTGKRDVHQLFMDLTDALGFQYNFGEGLSGEQLSEIRQHVMNRISELRDETVLPIEELYLCGGFRSGQVSPEHTWLEDRSKGHTYDTMADGGIVKINTVGVDGEPFQPGCEGDAFEADEIFRVKVSGYTAGQVAALFKAKSYKPTLFREEESPSGEGHDTTSSKFHFK